MRSVLRSLAALIRRKPPGAIAVLRDDAPRLWRAIDASAARAGARPPSVLWFVATVRPVRSRWSHLVVGLPLLEALTVDEMDAVLSRRADDALRSASATWTEFLERFVAPGMRYGQVPADLFGGFSAFLAHLSPDTVHATSLLDDLEGLRTAMQENLFEPDLKVLDWPELMADTHARVASDDARRLLAVTARREGLDEADLDTVLTAIEKGRGAALAPELGGEHGLHLRLMALVATALLDVGAVRPEFSWTAQPVRLRAVDGTELDLRSFVPRNLGSKAIAVLRAELIGHGVNLRFRPAS